ncbi:MAG: cupin domain-containing protein [Burkholderiales bacterium]
MRRIHWLGSGIAGAMIGLVTAAYGNDFAKPNLALHQVVEAMPTGQRQDVRVLTATFKPGDRTVTHTHRFPVTVYVLEGAFTLELEGREPIIVKAGEALVEPPLVKMTGYNRSASEPTRVVIFYVSEIGVPFLDLAHPL